MNKNWIGKVVSIKCVDALGIFQGTIKEANSEKITIVRAFRNGLPVRTLDTEITIMASDILKLELISVMNNENKMNGVAKSKPQEIKSINENLLSNKLKDAKLNKSTRHSPNGHQQQSSKQQYSNSPCKSFGNMIPPSVEVKLAASAPASGGFFPAESNHRNASKPIDIVPTTMRNGSSSSQTTPLKIERRKSNQTRRNAYAKNQAFGTPVDDPTMDEEFDFEKNLALFDKQAIWDEIDAIQKPDVVRQTISSKKKNFRHDENVILSKPIGLRQIKTDFQSSQEFSTDEGLIIPAIPGALRAQIQRQADSLGLSWERQCDMLARGTTDIALILLGGARRLTPQNRHQWPTIVIICDEPYNEEKSAIGISTGRQLASHGLKIMLYVRMERKSERKSKEMELYKATGSLHTNSIEKLPTCDLIILAIRSGLPSADITKWINDSRSPVLAIDPPIAGIGNVNVKCSILPMLPIDGISSACGKLYLCNLGIPDRIYEDAGIKYKSPFGHKFVIPVHLMVDDF